MLVVAVGAPRPSAQIPTSSTPPCEIDEYASMRLMLSWRTAVTLPIVMVSAATTAIGLAQPSAPNGTTLPPSATPNSRIIAAIAAALTPPAAWRLARGRGGAVVGVGRPHVERHRGDLLAERDHQHQPAGDDQAGVLGGTEPHRQLGDPGGAGRAVDQRDAVHQEPGRERADQEVLHRGLVAAPGVPPHRAHHVDAERHG